MTEQPFDLRRFIFRMRSYTPIPFLIVMVVFARPTAASLAVGLVILLLGEGLRFWGVSIAGAETRTTGTVGGTYLITNGPFAFVRNPLYLGNFGICLGLMLVANDAWVYALGIAFFFGQYFFIIRAEEAFLRERFGAAFDEFCAKVPRWVPRLSPAYPGSLREGGFDVRRAAKKEINPLAAWVTAAAGLREGDWNKKPGGRVW